MSRISRSSSTLVAVAAFAALVSGIAPGAASSTASLALLRRATNPNPGLNSYTASAQLTATLHALIPIRKSYGGMVYYLKPNRKIEFQGVSGALSRFKDLATTTPTYDQAVAQYAITPQTDTNGMSTYLLVPKNTGGRVKSVTVTVTDATGLFSRAVWAYTNGGSLTFDQTYLTTGTYRLPAKADIAARFPGYSVDGTITFSNYQPNASVSPSVFASPAAQ